MNDPRERQRLLNQSSRDHWEPFTAHREVVSRLVGAGSPGHSGRLCVLGAGNCHDLDLPPLLDTYREVHLVDLDRQALERGVGEQGVAGQPRLRLFGGLDLTAMLDALASWSPTARIPAESLRALAETPERLVPPALAGPYETVASTCLLRPIMGAIYHAVGDRHPRFAELVGAIRMGHLRLLSNLVTPGGVCLLITDIVSSETVPELVSVPDSALPALLRRINHDRNHFHGARPGELAAAFDRAVWPGAAAEPLAPWRWHLHGRVYLVWALRSRRPVTALTTHGP